MEKSGLAFHGEAARSTWFVTDVQCAAEAAEVILRAHLPETMLDVRRTFRVREGEPVVAVQGGWNSNRIIGQKI